MNQLLTPNMMFSAALQAGRAPSGIGEIALPLRTVTITLNRQQLELLDRTVEQGASKDRMELIYSALRGAPFPTRTSTGGGNFLEVMNTASGREREVLREYVMEPGTGKAVEVLKGNILRIEQIEGPQCVDFNCFNLHDYKEVMHAGRMRAVHGLRPTAGNFIWSAPPRERAMMYFLADTANCNDVMFSRCSAYLYESAYGFNEHTNCHDIQAEAQREYGLTPDDVHDSLNFFMSTGVENDRATIKRQHSAVGDHVELLALMDVLAVPNVCGNDVSRTSNFELKPVKITVLRASADDLARVPPLRIYPTNLRSPASFRQADIKVDRALKPDADYVPQFTNVPLSLVSIDVLLDADDYARLRKSGLQEYYGDDDGAILRDIVFSWWETAFTSSLPGTTR